MSATERSYTRFAFANDRSLPHDEILAQSRETLREMGSEEKVNTINLYLPFEFDSSMTSLANVKHDKALPAKTARIEVHNPSGRNAISGKMMAELSDIIAELEQEHLQEHLSALIVHGSDGWFCAGSDLRVAKEELSAPPAGRAMAVLMSNSLSRLRNLPLISVAVVDGGAYGGGAELAISCDFRVVEKKAIIQFVQTKMGVTPVWGGGVKLVETIGRRMALTLLGSAEKVDSQRAMEVGLADTVFDSQETKANEAVNTFLAPYLVAQPDVMHGTKRVVTNADAEGLARELEIFEPLWGGPSNKLALENALTKKNKTKSQL